MVDHPIRVAAAATGGVVTGTLLEQIVKRSALCLGPLESLGDIDQDSGEVAICVIHGATGYLYFYDDSDTTTLDDGLFTLVDGSGHRYHIQDAASLSLNSVLARQDAPPGSPTVGQNYIVGTSPSGAWASNANDLAVYTARGWIFASPTIGLTVYNQATSSNWLYDETPAWVNFDPLSVASGDAITDDASNKILELLKAGSAVNWVAVSNAATGNGSQILAKGGDTDVDLVLTPQGAGRIDLNGVKWPAADGAAGQVMTTDGAGSASWGVGGGPVVIHNQVTSGGGDLSEIDVTGLEIYRDINFEFTLGRTTGPGSGGVLQIFLRQQGGSFVNVFTGSSTGGADGDFAIGWGVIRNNGERFITFRGNSFNSQNDIPTQNTEVIPIITASTMESTGYWMKYANPIDAFRIKFASGNIENANAGEAGHLILTGWLAS